MERRVRHGYFATHRSVDLLKRAVSLTLPAMGTTRNAVPANVADSIERPLPAASTPKVVDPIPAPIKGFPGSVAAEPNA